ncbi:MAG: reprolysin-like metallopeptidase, partial [Saprospiraceae bacterium]
MKSLSLAFALCLVLGTQLAAQESLWQFVPEQTIQVEKSSRRIVPQIYQTARLDVAAMRAALNEAPRWFTSEAETKTVEITLPMPNGRFERFRIQNAPCMAPELARKFPDIVSYAGVGVDDPTAYLRGDLTMFGFHAMILGGRDGAVFIDPYSLEDTENYVVYYKKDYLKTDPWECLTQSEDNNFGNESTDAQRLLAGDCKLRTYSLALACTGEYATFHGGTVASVAAAMNTTMVRVNGVFEKDCSVHMDLVANNNSLIFLDAATDPYTNSNGSAMLSQNQTTCDNIIGNANYDIGHVFSTGGGGVAYLGALCTNSIKAGGVTGQPNPIGDPFDIDYVAHEMGHQYGANHTQNNSCNRNAATAMEPGSASTIMGYAGICSPNVQNNSDAYFHAISLQEIATKVTGSTCQNTLTTINNAPTADAGADYTIPRSTPFVLTGVGTDQDPNDILTYCWEQMDNAVATMPPVATNTGGPAFRSLTATTSPLRYFPNLPAVVANTTPTWEVLASVGRTYNFRLTVRDNRVGGGCTKEDNTVITVSGTAGPFLVTAPNTAVSWPALSTQTITWDVASTNAAPVNCANVSILLSTDGGLTYPITILANTPNDGSQTVTIPDNQTTQARIMVKSVGNVFYDISNTNFTITAPLNDFTFDVAPNSVSVCQPANAVYTVNIGASGSFSGNVTLAATGLPAGATASFSSNPVTAPGSSTLTINTSGMAAGNYSFNVTGTGSTGTKSETVGLVYSTGAAAAPALTAPANNATGVSNLPTFTWGAVVGVASYDLEVSTSAGFGTTVISQTGLTAATYTATTALNNNTLYYWRVRGQNACGAGTWSAVFSFTTQNITCTTFASIDVPKTISATGTPTVFSLLPISTLGTVTDVNLVNLNISHTYVNDLIVKLKNPAGTERTMFSQICGSQNNVVTNFDDEATNTYGQLPCPPTNNQFYQPLQTLAAFDNSPMNGNWTLTVSDVANSDGGALNSWSLYVCYAPAAPPLTASASSSDVLCNGSASGTATATATGGTPPYTYNWSNGATGANVSGLAAGNYTVTVTDAASATATASVSINQPNALVATATATNVPCFGGSTGTATSTASGGTAPYTRLWSNGATTTTINNLTAGTYTVTVTDANGCTKTATATVSQPASALSVAVTGVNPTSGSNGSATAAASGGTAPYIYLWSNGGTGTTITGLAAGTYTVTATDANGCTATGSVTLTSPATLNVGVSGTNVSCFGGSDGTATATATGGSGSYTFAWSNGQTTQTATGLVAGTYTVTVSDGAISATGSVTLTQPAAALSATASGTNPSCNGGTNGTATATATGGTAPYAFAWSNGQTTQTATNLAAGTYTVTATDANGCTATASATLTQPAGLTLKFT